MNKGLLIVISGPSGVGKGTVLSELFDNDANLAYSVSCTTRKPRENEVDGVHYHYITVDQFKENIQNGKMLEYTEYCGNYYGTGAEYVDAMRNSGKDVVLEIEIDGALQVMKKCKDVLSIFIAPPSFEVLKNRLYKRGTEKEEVIVRRVEKAKEELSHVNEYEYVVVNDELFEAVSDVASIIRAARIKNNKINYKF